MLQTAAKPREYRLAALVPRHLLTVVLLTSCGDQPEATRLETVNIGETQLTLSVPHRLRLSAIAGGVALRPRGASSLRELYAMTITANGAANTNPPLSLDRRRGTGAATVRYGIRRDVGGSGGEEVTLIAIRSCARTVLHLRFDAQMEDRHAVELEPAFAILESARCAAGDQRAAKLIGRIAPSFLIRQAVQS